MGFMKKLKQTLGPSNFSGSGQKVGGADAGSSTGPAPRSRPEVMASKVANTVSSPAPNTGGDTKTSTSTKPTDTREEMRKRAADAQTARLTAKGPTSSTPAGRRIEQEAQKNSGKSLTTLAREASAINNRHREIDEMTKDRTGS